MTSGSKPPATGLHLSEDGKTLLKRLAQFYGISMTAVTEIAIRELARKLNLFAPPEEPQ